jgi:hypothetical protein
MSTPDDVKRDLSKAREEVKRAFRDAIADGRPAPERLEGRLDEARARRDSLRFELHREIDERMRTLEAEQERLAGRAHDAAANAVTDANERIRDVEKRIAITRTELVTQADATLGDVDDEIHLLEVRARTSEPSQKDKANRTLADLRVKRDRLRDKALALRDSTGERLRQAKLEYEREVADLTERRNEGTVGLN